MKTTVEIPDALLEQLRRRAGREKTTLRALIHAALRQFLAAPPKGNGKFKLKDGSFRGEGLAPGIRGGDWDQIRSMACEGHGG